jgi:hypothetical protein
MGAIAHFIISKEHNQRSCPTHNQMVDEAVTRFREASRYRSNLLLGLDLICRARRQIEDDFRSNGTRFN